MEYFRLVKYPGSKGTLLPDIIQVFRKSGLHKLVDVFGGSGAVALNLNADQVVYNDINPDMANLFRTLKNESEDLEDAASLFMDEIVNQTRGRRFENLNATVRQKGNGILVEAGKGVRNRRARKALETIFGLTVGFGGLGDTYSTPREKSPYKSLAKAIESMRNAPAMIEGWTIECMDFRSLVSKWDGPGTFFYFDPPYPGKDWYGTSFLEGDFRDLKKIIDSLSGKYLLTVDAHDTDIEEIFGDPTFIKSYENRNGPRSSSMAPGRLRAFYTNV